jgi:Tol biopolymer transport system component
MKMPVKRPFTYCFLVAVLTLAAGCSNNPIDRAKIRIRDRYFEPCGPPYFIAQLTWSPDGNQIAYLSGESGEGNVWVTDTATGVSRPISNHSGPEDFPIWSADGGHLAFLARHNGQYGAHELWIVERDGTNSRPLMDSTSTKVVGSSSWSPDNMQLLFPAQTAAGNFGLFKFDLDTSILIQITSKTDINPVWSPDMQYIAFQSPGSGAEYHLTVTKPDGTGGKTLTHGIGLRLIRWAPDSTRLAFQTLTSDTKSIAVVNIDGTGVIRLMEVSANLTDLTWSPDGTSLLYATENEIGSISLLDHEHHILKTGDMGTEGEFSPDGTWYAYVQENVPPVYRYELFITSIDGSQTTQLTHSQGNQLCFEWPE